MHHLILGRIATACALTLALAACSNKRSEADELASARSALGQGKPTTARVHLLEVLQQNPASGEARYLLGNTLLEMGQPAKAEIEFRKALQSNASRDLISPAIAKTLLALRQERKLVDEMGGLALTTPAADADLKASIISAKVRLGDARGGLQMADEVLSRVPDHAPTLLAKARILVMTGSSDAASALVERVIARSPDDPNAWNLRGDLALFGKRKLDDALVSYKKVLEKQPKNVDAHSALIAIHAARNDLPAAVKQHAEMAKELPALPQTRFIEAQLAYAANDLKRARELLQQLQKVAPRNPRLLEFSGDVELRLGALNQAESDLSKAVALAPELVGARRGLARIHIRSGQHGKALDDLRPLLDKPSPDVETLTLAAEAYLSAGDVRSAETLFQRAAKLSPDDPSVRTALALSQFAKGRIDQAVAELVAVASTDAGTVADLALIAAHLRRQDLDGALKAIESLEKKEPKGARAPFMRGNVFAMKRDLVGARTNWEQALVREPNYFAATSRLAGLDAADGKIESARQRFEAVLKVDPNHLAALMALAELSARQNAEPEVVIGWLEKAITANSADAAPRLMLIDYLLLRGDNKKALSVAQPAAIAMPDNPAVVEAAGRAHLAANEVQQAITSFSKLTSMLPNSPVAYIKLATAYRTANNSAGAERSLKRAVELDPTNLDAYRRLIDLAMRNKKLDRAVEFSKQFQKQKPADATGYLLEGDVQALAKNWDAATAAYRHGITKVGDASTLAVRLHTVLSAQRPSEAEAFATDWLKRRKDPTFLFHLGTQALKAKNYELAERRYAEVAAEQPKNAMALNNVAWIRASTGKVGAVEWAEKAVALGPKNPTFLDTMAKALSSENQLPRAIETMNLAVSLAPRSWPMRLSLAKLYIKANDKQKARAELDQLSKLGDKFTDQAEVQSLLKSL